MNRLLKMVWGEDQEFAPRSICSCSGPSAAQTEVFNEQNAFYQQMMQQSATEFSEFQDVYNTLTTQLTPIFNAGPNQQGWSPAEASAVESQITGQTAQNSMQAAQAVNSQFASAGGGTQYVPQGAQQQVAEQAQLAVAGQKSQEELQATEANYQQGTQNWLNSAQLLGSASSVMNPEATNASVSNSAGSNVGTTANEITQAGNSWMGLVGGLANSAATGAGIAVGNCWIAEAVYGVNDLRTLMVRAWLNGPFSDHWYGKVVMGIYGAIGRPVAYCVRRSIMLRKLFKPLFDKAFRQAADYAASGEGNE